MKQLFYFVKKNVLVLGQGNFNVQGQFFKMKARFDL